MSWYQISLHLKELSAITLRIVLKLTCRGLVGLILIMLISSAFMQSMSAFVAQNYGAGRMDRAKKALYNGIGQTKFVMLQGIAGAFGVRVPVSYLMSIRPDTSLFKIGLATPMSSVVQLLLCLGFMVILNRRARKGEIR